MLLSLASNKGWPIETWDVSTALLYARLYGDRETDLDGQCIYIYIYETTKSHWKVRDNKEAEKGVIRPMDVSSGLGSGEG